MYYYMFIEGIFRDVSRKYFGPPPDGEVSRLQREGVNAVWAVGQPAPSFFNPGRMLWQMDPLRIGDTPMSMIIRTYCFKDAKTFPTMEAARKALGMRDGLVLVRRRGKRSCAASVLST